MFDLIAKESKRKAVRKEMDNVLKRTIRKEIEKYNKEKGEGSKLKAYFL